MQIDLPTPLKNIHIESMRLGRFFLKKSKYFEKENGIKLDYIQRRVFCLCFANLLVYTRYILKNEKSWLIKIFPGVSFGEGKEKEYIEIQILAENILFRNLIPNSRDRFLLQENQPLFEMFYKIYSSSNIYDNLIQSFSSYTVYHFLKYMKDLKKKRFVISTPELYFWIKRD